MPIEKKLIVSVRVNKNGQKRVTIPREYKFEDGELVEIRRVVIK